MNHLLSITSSCLMLLCIVSCEKNKQLEEGKKIQLTKITTEWGFLSYTYDASGKLTMEEYVSDDDAHKTIYDNYGSLGELLGFTIVYEKGDETDLRCENIYDGAGRLIKMNKYDLGTGVLLSYCTIEYGDGAIIRRQYNPPATLWGTDEYILTADKKNIAKYLFYLGTSTTPNTTITYGEYDDKTNPNTLLPPGYSPERMVLSQNNPLSSVWLTASMPPDMEISYLYSYEYNGNGCPVKFSTASELRNSNVFYEYNVD